MKRWTMLAAAAMGAVVLGAWAQEAVTNAPALETAGAPIETQEVNPLVHRFKQGGNTMWALVALSVVGLSSMLERLLLLRRSLVAPETLVGQADGLWRAGKHDELRALCEANPSTLGRILGFVSQHRDNTLPTLNEAAGDIARRDFRRHQRRAYPLAVVGTLSPLVGLFGTVVGLLEAFEAVAVAGSMDDPSILANSIAKALVTTVFGLVIAIPALVLYHFFKNRTGDLLDTLDEEVAAKLNAWYLK